MRKSKKIGQKFRNLTIVDSNPIYGFTHYVCRCDCGNEVIIPATSWEHISMCKKCRKKKSEMTKLRNKAYYKWLYLKNKSLIKNAELSEIWDDHKKFIEWMDNNNIAYDAPMKVDKGATIFSPSTVHFVI